MSFKPKTFKNLQSLFKHFRTLADESDSDLSELPEEISPTGLQLALVRVPVTLQNNFPHLSSISGGIRSLPTKLLSHEKYGLYFRPYTNRIMVAQRALVANNNQLLLDIALIECFLFFAMGLEKKDNVLRRHIEEMFLLKP